MMTQRIGISEDENDPKNGTGTVFPDVSMSFPVMIRRAEARMLGPSGEAKPVYEVELVALLAEQDASLLLGLARNHKLIVKTEPTGQ